MTDCKKTYVYLNYGAIGDSDGKPDFRLYGLFSTQAERDELDTRLTPEVYRIHGDKVVIRNGALVAAESGWAVIVTSTEETWSEVMESTMTQLTFEISSRLSTIAELVVTYPDEHGMMDIFHFWRDAAMNFSKKHEG